MGNQPSRKTTRPNNNRRASRKMINSAKRTIHQKNVKQTVEIAIGGGLNANGKGVLSTSLLAACEAYSQYKNKPKSSISQISSESISSIIKSTKSTISGEGRSVLKSSIETALTSLEQND